MHAIVTIGLLLLMPASGAQGARKPMLTNIWRGLKPGVATQQDVITALGPPDRESRSATYGSLEGLELLTYDDLVASVFLKGGRVALIVTQARDGEFPEKVEKWEAELGRPARRLPSIRGKNSRVNIYSEQGMTATSDDDHVTLVEIFPPMSPDEYVRLLYKKPPVFRK